MNTAVVSFLHKTGRKFSIAGGIPFNILFPGNQAGLLSAMPKSLQLSALSGCLNSGVPKGLDNPMVILLRLETPSAWLYMVHLGTVVTKLGLVHPFLHPPTCPAWADQPPTASSSTWNCNSTAWAEEFSVSHQGRWDPYTAGALYARIAFSCGTPISPHYPTELGLGEYSHFTHSLFCAHGDSTAHGVFSV